MSRLPSINELLLWIRENPDTVGKREIARAFGLKGADRIALKRMLRELADRGEIVGRRKAVRPADTLPPVAVLQVTGCDAAGEPTAAPARWDGAEPPPAILVLPAARGPNPGAGDRILARMSPPEGPGAPWLARVIRVLATGPRRITAIFRDGPEGGRLVPIAKGDSREWRVAAADRRDAQDGELVEAEQTGPADRLGLPRAKVTARLGDPTAAKAVSLIAIHDHAIPDSFAPAALEEAAAARPVPLGRRTDLRDLPLVTIDPSDARDHDDAVCAAPDDDPANPGGHVVWVAIADVAAYVTPGSALDREAWLRGNSTYFPDRVVPMLPERLSADLCSLIPGADRPCIAVRLVLDARGAKRRHSFHRGLMRSPAALSYEQVQAAIDGRPDADTAPLLDSVLRPLWAAWHAARAARARRGPLDLEIPERRIVLGADGRVASVAFRDRLDAHRVIEDFMILANVACAETLERRRRPHLYRVHEEPAPERIEALVEMLETVGIGLAKGAVMTPKRLNRVLDQAAGTEFAEMVNLGVLRAMTQAYYAPDNLGHFGLALPRYTHFTSPIRRYADLVAHRALIRAHGWGDDGITDGEEARLAETGEQISKTERRSMMAERDTTDRYLAAYLADRIGTEFEGAVSGIARFGLFVKLDGTGADGLVPIGRLGHEYFRHNTAAQTLIGERSGRVIGLGMRVRVRLVEAAPITGGLLFDLLEVDGRSLPTPRGRGKPGPRRGQAAMARRKAVGRRIARRRG